MIKTCKQCRKEFEPVRGNTSGRCSTECRFWAKVDKGPTEACWKWKGVKTEGYGMFCVEGEMVLAHNWLWSHIHGRSVPEGMYVCHAPIICHNRACLNPDHLRLDSPTGNAKDRKVDGTEPDRRGEKNVRAKLSKGKVFLIREMWTIPGRPYEQKELAEIFGVNQSQISSIVRGESWKHLLEVE